ncbi:MAG: protein kinase [Deltaproteobacteria bacterium]|nr:protein kinase [Deltaproteobacteria bacterium]
MADAFPRKFGKYYLLSPLAQGGMGALYMAMAGERDLEKLCVIKTVLPHLADSEYVARFRDEAKVVVRLSHGNLVPVFDAGQVQREIFLAMDFVEGKDLRAVWNRCAKKGIAFPLDVAAYIVKELCRGLHYAHSFQELRLVHRDVSPPNVLLSYTGEVKLTDFGLASSTLKLEKTSPGVIYGKVSYMSPEQARGEPLDGRTDLYAAGIILWELLTGRQLFPAGEAQATDLLQRARDPRPEAPSRRAARVPPALDAIVLKALAVSPAERYQSGEEMRSALAGYLAAEAPSTDSARVATFMDQLFAEDKPGERAGREGLVAKVRDSLRTQPALQAVGEGELDSTGAPKRRLSDRVGDLPRRRAEDGGGPAAGAAGGQGAGAAGAGQARMSRLATERGGPEFRAVDVPPVGPPGAPTLHTRLTTDTDGSAAIKRAPDDIDTGVVGTIIDGRYSVLRLIGEGGMGRVYEAEHIEIGKRVALKILHQVYSRTPEVVERFRREARAASRIGHPNIVDVTDSGQTPDGSVYFAMEMLEGIELAAVIDREGALAPARALSIAQQMCRALKAAHDAGIIHRDLKPENVFLVVRDNTADFVKVLDFGIAKVADLEEPRTGRLTHPGMAMGTPEYMAPEQAAGKPADPRSDVYAVGAIIYEMLTGVPPYTGDNFMEILSKKASTEPRPPRELNRELPEIVEQVVLRAMARDPAARPQTMDALEYDLTKCFAGRGLAVARLLGLPVVEEGGVGSATTSGITTVPQASAQQSMPSPVPTGSSVPQTSQPTEEVWQQRRGARGWLVALLLFTGAGAAGWYGYQRWRDGKQADKLAAAGSAAGTGAGPEVTAPMLAVDAGPGPTGRKQPRVKDPGTVDPTAGGNGGPSASPAASPSPSKSPGPVVVDTSPAPSPSEPDDRGKSAREREKDKAEAKKLLATARAAEARMEWAEARAAYDRLLSNGHNKGAALTGLASVAWQTKDLARTIDLAKQAIKAGGGNKARMLLGHAYFKQRDFAAAVASYEEVLKTEPEHREAQTALKAAKRQGGIP